MPKITLSVRDIDSKSWQKMHLIAFTRGIEEDKKINISVIVQEAIDEYLARKGGGK